MAGNSAQEIKEEVRGYFVIFTGLLLLSFATVGIYYLHLPLGWAIFFALLISCVQVFLAAGYFMHLISEKMVILYALLAMTALFVSGALALPVIEHIDSITGTVHYKDTAKTVHTETGTTSHTETEAAHPDGH